MDCRDLRGPAVGTATRCPHGVWGPLVPTRTTHFLQVQAYLGFRPALPLDFAALTAWLVERVLEHNKPTLLL